MNFKVLLSTVIAFVAITVALGYFGLSKSFSALHISIPGISTTSSVPTLAHATSTAELPPPKNAAPLPPADPAKSGIEIPKVVFPKFPVESGTPTIPATPVKKPTPIVTTPTKPTPTPVVVPKPAPAPSTPAPEPNEPAEQVQVGTAKSFAEGAAVNIVCNPLTSPMKKSISGSGTIIDSRGIILTVAHVGHYFLLENYPSVGSADCVVRTGSPAKTAYDAKLIYVSPDWVKANAGALAQNTPQGNGQNDFAFLAITTSLTGKRLPSSFTSVPLTSDSPSVGDDVALGTYGAEFLTGSQIQNSLYPTIVNGSIKSVYTYTGKKNVDVISVFGSLAAQSGSSGGGIVNTSGRYTGLITTSSLGGPTTQRTLYAITPNYIRTAFKADTGKDLDAYLSGDLDTLVSNFADEIPGLAKTVWNAIN